MFSLAIVVVVVIHAIMYFKQAKAMDATLQQGRVALEISERAYVGVRSVDLVLLKVELLLRGNCKTLL
jgi:hypothetical protein